MAHKEKKTPKRKLPGHRKSGVKDVVIYALLLSVLCLIVYSRLYELPIREWGTEIMGIIGDLVIYLLGIVGFFEFGYDNGLTIIVPNNFIAHKEQKLREQTKEYLHQFFDEESEYMHLHEQDRMSEMLSLMGLSMEEFQKVQAKALEARLSPMYDIESAREKLLDIVFFTDTVIDLKKTPHYLGTQSLRYYMKFHDLMHNSVQSDLIAQIMATFVALTCEKEGIKMSEIDVVMVPHSSNYLLGLKVSKLLSKKFIKMIPPSKVIKPYYFEGNIPEEKKNGRIRAVVIHDVLLSGGQIVESIETLKEAVPDCQIVGLFSAIYRNVWDGRGKLEREWNIKCYNLAEMTEEEIQQKIESMVRA